MPQPLARAEAEKIFDTLYETVDGYAVSGAAKKKLGLTDEIFTYGEITFDGFAALLEALDARGRGTFYDLGAGTGKPVIAAALLGNFSRLVGVELVPDLAAAASAVAERLRSELAPALSPAVTLPEIAFINEGAVQPRLLGG